MPLRARRRNIPFMTARSHFGSVRKLPSGRFQAGYWHDGRRLVAPTTFQAKNDAKAWLAAKETDILRGEWTDPSAGKVTFGEFAQTWFDHQRHLRPTTHQSYEGLLRRHLRPTFAERQLSAITRSEVEGWHRTLLSKRPGTAPTAYRLLAQIMRAAVRDGHITRTPVEIKGASKALDQDRPVPTVAEVDAIAASVPERYRAMVLVAAWCGLRFGELAALRRDRVDLLHGQIKVTETLTELARGVRFIGPPKTAAGRRTVAIPPHIVPVLEAHLDAWSPTRRWCSLPRKTAATCAGTISTTTFGQRHSERTDSEKLTDSTICDTPP